MKSMKKVAVIFGVLLAVLVSAAVIIPLVVDIDHYRPQIVEAANQKINGRLELGKLKLSLWGQVRIEVAGLKLKDHAGQELVSVQDAYFHLPLLNLISGSPVITFKLKQPMLNVVKDKSGRLNLLSLLKKEETAQKAPSQAQTPTPTQPQAPKGPTALPEIATRARLGIEMTEAHLSYRDLATGLTSKVDDLNFMVRDLSLSHPMEAELWADLKTQMGKAFALHGPAKVTATLTPEINEGHIALVKMAVRADMDQVDIAVPGAFVKKSGIPANLETSLTVAEPETNPQVKIEKLEAEFFNAKVHASGKVFPSVQMEVSSNEIALGPWVELVPMLKQFELGGSASFQAQANGPAEQLKYRARLNLKELSAKSPGLKAQPKFGGHIQVITDQVESLLLTMKAPGNDLTVNGKVVSFTHPKVDLAITSTGMDLDQLIDFPPPPPKGKETAAAKVAEPSQPSAPSAQQAPKQDPKENYDAMLDPIRSNKTLASLVINLTAKLPVLKVKGVRISDINCQYQMKDLAMNQQCGLGVFSGTIKNNFSVNLAPHAPQYKFGSQVAGFDIGQAVESQMELFKNTLKGKASFSMTGEGASFNTPQAISNLKANGNMRIDRAVFTTIDVMKMTGEALGKSLSQIGEKVPALKGRSIGNLPSGASQYESISSDFSIAGGKFTAPNFVAKAAPNQGIDLKGSTAVGLKDFSIDANWEVIDTYNLTHAKDLSIEQSGVKVEHLLAEGNGPVRFPIHVGCTLSAPCYSYTQVPEFLGKVALGNLGAALSNRARDEARKQAENAIKRVVPPAMQEKVQEKLKGFFQ